MRYLQFADNNDMKKPGERGYDKCHKVRPLLSHVQENLAKLTEREHSAVDEQMIPFKGRSSLKQYIKNKPHKWGIKVFTRASSDGVMHQFQVYVGAATCTDFGLGFSGNIVQHLCQNLPKNENYKVLTDNYFSSIALAVALKEAGIFMVGTIRSDRMKSCPLFDEKTLKKKGRGAVDCITEMRTGTNLIRWVDKKTINFISTYAAVNPVGEAMRWNSVEKKKTPIPRPDVVAKYNSFMGGFDL